MTTQTWVSAVSHANDADFRAWGSELSGKFAAAGLVKHTDTGQINWTTVTRPAANTAGGYEIWRFDDPLQATAPIFLKMEYGTGSAAANPQCWITVGTGSNGSGTLTGQTSTQTIWTFGLALSSTVTAYPSYVCVAPGHVGVAWKLGAYGGAGFGFLAITRTHDTSGAPTGTGFVVYFAQPYGNMLTSQSVRTAATAAAYATTTAYCIAPGQPLASLVGSSIQAYAHFAISPQVWTLPTLASIVLTEAPPNTTFSVAMVGSAPRTFLSIGGGSGFYSALIGVGPGSAGTYGIAMLWE